MGSCARTGRAAAVVALVSLAVLASVSAASDSIPAAQLAAVDAAMGAVFVDGVGARHDCTASVIRSPGRDVVLTAAHCLQGTGRGVQFAPGYRDGRAPAGLWDVAAVYVDPRWTSEQDPQHDYAFLVVAAAERDGRRVRLGDLVQGNRLGRAPAPGSVVEVVAYAGAFDPRPISCTTATYTFAGFPAFDCDGYSGGASGAPWLSRGPGGDVTVSGVIGGLHQGGCFDDTSYSPRFDGDTAAVYERAVRGAEPDTLPAPRGDGC